MLHDNILRYWGNDARLYALCWVSLERGMQKYHKQFMNKCHCGAPEPLCHDFRSTVQQVTHFSRHIPETLDVWGDARQSVDPIHNAMFLNKLCTLLQNLGNWRQDKVLLALQIQNSFTAIRNTWRFHLGAIPTGLQQLGNYCTCNCTLML